MNNQESISLDFIIKQLDKWISDSEEQSQIFTKNNMEIAAMGSDAMAQAYWNVKQFIEVNNKK